MKTRILLSAFTLIFAYSGNCTIWTITNTGETFSPASITVNFGDTIEFVLDGSHNAVQVSQTTWNANGSTPLAGGFQTSFGGGTVYTANHGTGTYYYVCSPHASLGMKGVIQVEGTSNIPLPAKERTFGMYPNPADNILFIRIENWKPGINFRVLDITGRAVLEGTLVAVISEIDISRLSTGVYIMQVPNLKGQKFKVVKK